MRIPGQMSVAAGFALAANLAAQPSVSAASPLQAPNQPMASIQQSPPSAPGTPNSNAVRISGGVMAGQILSRVNPEYPADARANGVEGTVVLYVHVGKDGTVESAVPISGPDVF